MRQDAVGDRCESDRNVSERILEADREPLGTLESRRRTRARRRLHRQRRIEDEPGLGVGPNALRGVTHDRRLRCGDAEQSRNRKRRNERHEAHV